MRKHSTFLQPFHIKVLHCSVLCTSLDPCRSPTRFFHNQKICAQFFPLNTFLIASEHVSNHRHCTHWAIWTYYFVCRIHCRIHCNSSQCTVQLRLSQSNKPGSPCMPWVICRSLPLIFQLCYLAAASHISMSSKKLSRVIHTFLPHMDTIPISNIDHTSPNTFTYEHSMRNTGLKTQHATRESNILSCSREWSSPMARPASLLRSCTTR